MIRVIPIRKPAVLIGCEKLADLAQGCGVFLIAQMATVSQPRIKANSRGFGGFSRLPSSDAQAGGQLTGCGYQGKAVNGSAYLITGALWGHGGDQSADLGLHPSAVCVQVIGQCLYVGPKGGAVLALQALA
ncbi:hypothetical protein D3C75_787770 [compost metagenome]